MASTGMKILQCWCFHQNAYNVAACIDYWHAQEACGLSSLYCDACCWTLCAPICIDCKCGDKDKACDNCMKSLKYCGFSCALQCVACIDGCYNCGKVICIACDTGINSHKQLMENTQFLHNKVKECLSLETGN